MAYCTQADILLFTSSNILKSLTDFENSGSINVVRVTAAIERADSFIDSYITNLPATASTAATTLIKHISIQLSLYFLYLNSVEGISDSRKTEFETIIKALGKIQKSGFTCDANGTSVILYTHNADDKIYTLDTLENF